MKLTFFEKMSTIDFKGSDVLMLAGVSVDGGVSTVSSGIVVDSSVEEGSSWMVSDVFTIFFPFFH